MIIDKKEDLAGHTTIFQLHGKQLTTSAHATNDGRLAVDMRTNKDLPDIADGYAKDVCLEEFGLDRKNWREVPKLGIVLAIAGAKDDVYSYIALGRQLSQDGHYVRLVTHLEFRDMVTENDLEFFDIGGSSEDLAAYAAKSLLPAMGSLTNSAAAQERELALRKMMESCWEACHKSSDAKRPFAADAIISNPSTLAHVHIAEALGIPLHMSSSTPWTPTIAFPHPLVHITSSNTKPGLTNALSYGIAEYAIWQGIENVVNSFRKDCLGLESIGARSGPGILDRLRVPWTYYMSPTLIPKPKDWLSNIDATGFYLSNAVTEYCPPDALSNFLAAGSPPVFIGFDQFGDLVPTGVAGTIFEASANAGVRILLSIGRKMEFDGVQVPEHVFLIDDVPHDWLFSQGRVQAVIHYGGAGITALGLATGRPTAVVPYSGDQTFWADVIYRNGVGPGPILPLQLLDVHTLVETLLFITSTRVKDNARRLGKALVEERGVVAGVESFYRHLPLLNMRCDLDSSKLAVWWSPRHYLKLSAFAVQVLLEAHILDIKELEPHRPKEYETRREISDPITGGLGAVFYILSQTTSGVAQLFYSPWRGIIKTTIVVPFSAFSVLFGVSEGMHNTPRLYGSQVRPNIRPKDWKSGLAEGGKSMYFGFYDAFKGLYQLPVEGAKKEGAVGALKGSAISIVDLAVKPVAGALNFVSQPIEGSWKSMKSLVSKNRVNTHYLARVAQGIDAVRESSETQRAHVLDMFMRSKETIKERQEAYRQRAMEAMEQRDTHVVDSSQPGPPPYSAS